MCDSPGSNEGGCSVGEIEGGESSRSRHEGLNSSCPDGSITVEIKRSYRGIDRQSINDGSGPINSDEVGM